MTDPSPHTDASGALPQTQKRMAVCLSGQPRTWRHCIDSLKTHFSGYDVDFFLHLWDEVDPAELEDLKAAYAPVDMIVEPRPDFSDLQAKMAPLFPENPQPFAYDMFFAVGRVLQLALAHDQAYDLYARVRYDCLFDGPCPDLNLAETEIFGFDAANSFHFQDVYAIGGAAAMAVYAHMFTWMQTGFPGFDRNRLVGEYALFKYLSLSGVHIQRDPRRAFHSGLKLLRPNMVGRPFAHVRHDILFDTRKAQKEEAYLRARLPQDRQGQVISTSPYVPHLELFEHIEAWRRKHPSQAETCLRGPWATRLRHLDRYLDDLCNVSLETLDLGAQVRLVRMAITFVMNTMDFTTAPDLSAVVLMLLSFEGEDHEMAASWARDYPEETALMLQNPDLQMSAPRLMFVLGLMCQAANPAQAHVATVFDVLSQFDLPEDLRHGITQAAKAS